MMRAPSKPSRIPRYTTLHQPVSKRGCSAPVANHFGFVPNNSLRQASNSAGETGSNVREFFKERRHVDNRYPLQDIKHHYNKYKGQPATSPTKAKPPPALRQKPPPPRQPAPIQRPPVQRQGWNRNNPLPSLNRGNDTSPQSPANHAREDSDIDDPDNDGVGERALTIEEIQKKEDQDRIIALIEAKERELQNMRSIQKQKDLDDQRQKERDRLRKAKPRVKPMEWQNDSPEPSQGSRRLSPEEENNEDPPFRKPTRFRRQTTPARDDSPPRQRYREPSIPPKEPSPPPRKPSPPPQRRRKPPPQKRVAKSPKMREESPPPRDAAVSYDIPLDATYEPVAKLARCGVCGRNFAEERIAKHKQVCSKADKAQSKRKVFDPVKMRTAGTEQAQFVNSKQPEPPKKPKKDWRKAHEELIKTLRYNKKVSEFEKNGGNLAELPPPPPTEHPDYVECPYCSRKFNEGAAERHIPRCKDTKNKAKPPPRGGKRR